MLFLSFQHLVFKCKEAFARRCDIAILDEQSGSGKLLKIKVVAYPAFISRATLSTRGLRVPLHVWMDNWASQTQKLTGKKTREADFWIVA